MAFVLLVPMHRDFYQNLIVMSKYIINIPPQIWKCIKVSPYLLFKLPSAMFWWFSKIFVHYVFRNYRKRAFDIVLCETLDMGSHQGNVGSVLLLCSQDY